MLSFEQRSVVVIFADPSALATAFVEALVAGLSRVLIITDKVSVWRKNLVHLSQNKSVDVTGKLQNNILGDSSYFVFIHCEENPILDQRTADDKEKQLEEVLLKAKELQSKALVVLPHNLNSYEEQLFNLSITSLKSNDLVMGIVCLGELFGTRMSFSSRGIVAKTIRDAISGSILKEYKYVALYPSYIPDVAKGLVKSLFSFGSMGTTSFMYSKKIYSSKFALLLKEITSCKIHTEAIEPDARISPEISLTIDLKTDLKIALKETLEWFKQYGSVPTTFSKEVEPVKLAEPTKSKKPPKVILPKPRKKKKNIKSRTWMWGTIMFIAILVSSPVLLVISASSLWVAMNQALAGREVLAQTALSFSAASSDLALKEAGIFTRIPIVSKAYDPVVFFSSFVHRLTLLGERGLIVYHFSSQIIQKSLAGESYDLKTYSEQISLELDLLYREMGFLQSEVNDGKESTKNYANMILDRLDFTSLKGKILSSMQIVEALPTILGDEAAVTYLILFQNNMELRPTGGFIGSYAIITLKDGNILDLNVSDVYTADGQLKGHVEPPKPINDYLGEANWFLRDSNWDPDFPSSATTAEWFLEKEVGQSVDGVIALDLEFARELIRVTGPIYLPDFDKEIDSNNLYEMTQYEVEKDFFPGSQKKANFLTALTRQLLDELINTSSNQYIEIGRVFSKSLDEKHIQVFLHNKETQRAFADLGWDGGVYQPSCSGNCYADWLGIVDANVGVNKANYFIERSSVLNITMNDGEVTKELTVLIENNASPALGNEATYKSYLRVLSPQQAYFSDIEIIDSTEKEFVVPEVKEVRGRKEAGVYVEVAPGRSKNVVFSWKEKINISFEIAGEYRLYWRKQAGTISDKITANFALPNAVDPFGQESLSLTNEGIFVYNTNLARDYSSRIFW